MKIFNTTKKTTVAGQTKVAGTFFFRMMGLLNRKSLDEGEGLIILSCQQIHMVFMRFPIDVIFVDKNHKVAGLVKNIQPFGFSPIFWKASFAIELPTTTIEKSQTQVGDILEFIPALRGTERQEAKM